MITHADVAMAEFVIDESSIIKTIAGGINTDQRGRKPKTESLRLLLVGMFLSINKRRSATITDIHRTLTEEIPYDEQFRLGSRTNLQGVISTIQMTDLYYQANKISERLSYGSRSNPNLSIKERSRRHDVITSASNALMDVFDFGWKSSTWAIDATGIWSWAKGGKKHGNDIEELQQAIANGLDTEELIKLLPADAYGYTNSCDPDAKWGLKTSKSGKVEPVFGYEEHTGVLVPDRKTIKVTDKDGKVRISHELVEPPIIRRLELAPATLDVVGVTLRLIDSVTDTPLDIIVDRHYSYKDFDDWLSELHKRKIRQHLDLRADDQGFIEFDRMPWAAGCAHCPGTPRELGEIPMPALNAPKETFVAFAGDIALREAYKMRIVNQPDATGAMRVQCPARAGTVGCPLRPGTVEVAMIAGLPIVADPPVKDPNGEPLPRVCTQTTFKTRPPKKIRKLMQFLYWGSRAWRAMYARRTYVEGCYGNRKNGSTENLRRGFFRSVGLPWANLTVSMSAASYNARMIQNWHARTGKGDPENPIIKAMDRPGSWMYLEEDEMARIQSVYEIKVDG